MSSLMTGMIWKAKGLQGVERLILLAIADEANSMGSCIIQGELLARKVDMGLEPFMVQLTKLSSKKYITVGVGGVGLVVSTLTAMARVGQANPTPPLESPKSTISVLTHLDSRVADVKKKREAKASTKKDSTVAVPRARNPLWDAVAQLYGPPLTKSEQSDFGKTVKELGEAQAKPEDVAGFKGWWQREFPDASCTHRCLRLHWSAYMAALVKRSSKSNVLDL